VRKPAKRSADPVRALSGADALFIVIDRAKVRDGTQAAMDTPHDLRADLRPPFAVRRKHSSTSSQTGVMQKADTAGRSNRLPAS
jgi:hypothetical protein